MVSPLSLAILAAVLALVAVLVGRLRGRSWASMTSRGAAALAAATLALLAVAGLFGAAGGARASPLWAGAARWALLLAPLAPTAALRMAGRRWSLRAFLGSTIALAGVLLWLTLNLRGPLGGWEGGEVALVSLLAALALSAGACLGAWSRRPPDETRRAVLDAAATGSGILVGTLALSTLVTGACGGGTESREAPGDLRLTVIDGATGEATPARVELLDAAGVPTIPDDSLRLFDDCGRLPGHAWVPGLARIQALTGGRREISNPYRETVQFYVDGSSSTRLPAGSYTVRATKGIEFEAADAAFDLAAGESRRLELTLRRWIDLPGEGWHGADDHLHIPRPHPSFDPDLTTWMEAEGLHVANLLQMGLARDVHLTPQHGFGPEAIYRRGDTLLLSGQENPRTHVLGHAIVLGARRFLDRPSDYLLYDRVWEEARRQGAANGYAHWALGGAEEGLALWGHAGLLDFVEVLNLGFPFYDRWYEALDLGLRLGPTAGTDYPCLPGLPGRERFYARTGGELEVESWLEAVRRGATFVTNGPAIELTAGEALPGDELQLPAPGRVAVRGRVRFDRERDDVQVLELIRSGAVVRRVEAPPRSDEIRLDTTVEIDRTSWLALRATGAKRGETKIDLKRLLSTMLVLERPSNESLLQGLPEGAVPRPSAAHTGAILITVEGTPTLAEQPRGREVARLWRQRLHRLERRFGHDELTAWARYPGRGDGIDAETARANRAALLEAMEAAKRHLATVGEGAASADGGYLP